MCIVCDPDDPKTGTAYLDAYREAQRAMKAACQALHAVATTTHNPVMRQAYTQAHCQAVRVLRAWNTLEHTRGKGLDTP